MGGKWKQFGFNLHKVLCAVLMIHLLSDECLSINLEGLALLEFRLRVESDPFEALENWDASDSDPCNWTGVHCLDGKVGMLNLTDFSLQGTLSPELGRLSSMRALVLYRNNFYGVIPEEIGKLTMLEFLDLRSNMLSSPIPEELIEMPSLKHLLLCNNKFQGNKNWMENPNMHFDLIQGRNLSCDDVDNLDHISGKLGPRLWEIGWQKSKKITSFLIMLRERIRQSFDILPIRVLHSSFRSCKGSSSAVQHEGDHNNLATDPGELYIISNVHINALHRRRMIEGGKNLRAAPGNEGSLNIVGASPIPSGAYPAVQLNNPFPSSSPPKPEPLPGDSTINEPSSKRSAWWMYILIFAGAFLLLMAVLFMCCFCCKRSGATIGPWRTGLSGQLQKAFVTGVPELKRPELLSACEDFSNIIISFPEYIIYKGTLSSGVEIAVSSTTIICARDWSRHSEMIFRKKVAAMSRINHKNYVNLLGYCKEDQPFMRMMVLEYAPNGTLYEHLHLEESERLDWNSRLRIIMGIAYCLHYIHELKPPLQHPDLNSNFILVTEDCTAKIGDYSVWKQVMTKGKGYADADCPQYDHSSNIYSFGLLLLEIISGKVIQDAEQDSLLNKVSDYLNGNDVDSLVDSSLKCRKRKELQVICEVIQDCTNTDPKKRPPMDEVTSKLRAAIPISPEAAAPSHSPLWWAELEILSVEAS